MEQQTANQEVYNKVQGRYSEIAENQSSCCGDANKETENPDRLGYGEEEMTQVSGDSVFSLGCGNPGAMAVIQPGDTILDLGSGAGLDCFLAARRTGESGQVIGIDMTPEMVEKAKRNAREHGFANVEFREGMIEDLPVETDSIDVVMSNCVINLSPEKPQVFGEIFRVLKPGGQMVVSDVVAKEELPQELKDDLDSLAACVSGAATESDLRSILRNHGFTEISFEVTDDKWAVNSDCCDNSGRALPLVSALIQGRKPEQLKES